MTILRGTLRAHLRMTARGAAELTGPVMLRCAARGKVVDPRARPGDDGGPGRWRGNRVGAGPVILGGARVIPRAVMAGLGPAIHAFGWRTGRSRGSPGQARG